MDSNVEVAIVMPAYNAAAHLQRTLPAALAAAAGGRVLVVDPGSTDDTASVARELGAEVVRLPERAGPAEARNAGVQRVEADVVLFIDSDCVAHPDVVERVRVAFASEPSLVSLTGSYDADPPQRNFFSQYMNLRHHFTHQNGRTEDASFWAGCGAVRRSAFVEIGGFDVERFPRPMIEDIELGLRLSKLGRTRLDPGLQVTHLKRWTLRSVVETDIRFRALPWGQLVLETRVPNDLNLRWSQRIAAALAPFALLGLPAAALAGLAGRPLVAVLALAPPAASLLMHRQHLRFFTRLRGLGFALRFWLFQQVHLVYSAATMAFLVLRRLLARKASPPPEPASAHPPQSEA